ncbi:hypothetical protein V6N13_004461 [Hibiscus sabdariffa]|uniref:Uncharacterized protein n=1 Tax=Hibiscus sabdariffa TaxID=183260 RepID=A0ABR2RYJ2_9ROSI
MHKLVFIFFSLHHLTSDPIANNHSSVNLLKRAIPPLGMTPILSIHLRYENSQGNEAYLTSTLCGESFCHKKIWKEQLGRMASPPPGKTPVRDICLGTSFEGIRSQEYSALT